MDEEVKLDEIDLLRQKVSKQLGDLRPKAEVLKEMVKDLGVSSEIFSAKNEEFEKDGYFMAGCDAKFFIGKPIPQGEIEVVPILRGEFFRHEFRLQYNYKPWYKPYQVIVAEEEDIRTGDYIRIRDSFEEFFEEHLALAISFQDDYISLFRGFTFFIQKDLLKMEIERFNMDVKVAKYYLDREQHDTMAGNFFHWTAVSHGFSDHDWCGVAFKVEPGKNEEVEEELEELFKKFKLYHSWSIGDFVLLHGIHTEASEIAIRNHLESCKHRIGNPVFVIGKYADLGGHWYAKHPDFKYWCLDELTLGSVGKAFPVKVCVQGVEYICKVRTYENGISIDTDIRPEGYETRGTLVGDEGHMPKIAFAVHDRFIAENKLSILEDNGWVWYSRHGKLFDKEPETDEELRSAVVKFVEDVHAIRDEVDKMVLELIAAEAKEVREISRKYRRELRKSIKPS